MTNDANAEMTQTEATDEALLLFLRKMRRTSPDAFGKVWEKLPREARDALHRAEMRADVRRDTYGTRPVWPVEPDLDRE